MLAVHFSPILRRRWALIALLVLCLGSLASAQVSAAQPMVPPRLKGASRSFWKVRLSVRMSVPILI